MQPYTIVEIPDGLAISCGQATNFCSFMTQLAMCKKIEFGHTSNNYNIASYTISAIVSYIAM